MIVVDQLRVLDLSSDIPHRPTVGYKHSSPPHSTTPSKSLPVSGISLHSRDYTLSQEVNEILTPVINKLMSSPPSPELASSVPVAMSNDTRRHTTEVTRRRAGSSHAALSRFTQWDSYRQSREPVQCIKNASIKQRHASLKRTDFTSRNEIKRHGESTRFIFHKGFFKRNSNDNRPNRKLRKLRNRAEINAVLTYTDLQSFDPSDVISSGRAFIYKSGSIRRRYPRVKIASEIPTSQYAEYVSKKKSLKSSRFSGNFQAGIGRSNTCPPAIRSIRRRSYSPENRRIHDLWKEYLSLVVAQRIYLRIALTACNSESEGESEDEIPYEGSEGNPIVIGGFDDHSLHMYENSIKSSSIVSNSTITSQRKYN